MVQPHGVEALACASQCSGSGASCPIPVHGDAPGRAVGPTGVPRSLHAGLSVATEADTGIARQLAKAAAGLAGGVVVLAVCAATVPASEHRSSHPPRPVSHA